MKNNNNNVLASDAATLCLEVAHVLDASNIVAALTDFLVKYEEVLSAEEFAHLAADVERLTDKPCSLVYAGWARTTLADIWRSHR